MTCVIVSCMCQFFLEEKVSGCLYTVPSWCGASCQAWSWQLEHLWSWLPSIVQNAINWQLSTIQDDIYLGSPMFHATCRDNTWFWHLSNAEILIIFIFVKLTFHIILIFTVVTWDAMVGWIFSHDCSVILFLPRSGTWAPTTFFQLDSSPSSVLLLGFSPVFVDTLQRSHR